MSKRKLILAGNYHEYENYLRESGEDRRNSTYVSNHLVLKGMRDFELVPYGTFYERNDIHEIEDELAMHGIKCP